MHRALGAKACHPDQRFCRWKLLFYQQPCAKAKEFGEAEFWDSMPVFYGGILYWLLEKQGKLYFLQSSQTKGRDVLASKKPSLVQLPCAKTAKSCAFCDSLPVSASVCVFAFDTGGLGLWLGALGRSRLYRCQSVPGPPMPCFCGTELCFGTELRFGSLCNQFLPKTLRFSLQRHKTPEFGEAEFWG